MRYSAAEILSEQLLCRYRATELPAIYELCDVFGLDWFAFGLVFGLKGLIQVDSILTDQNGNARMGRVSPCAPSPLPGALERFGRLWNGLDRLENFGAVEGAD
jgi:hypothetical protein